MNFLANKALMKGIAVICYILGTIMLLSPYVAAHSFTPWILYFIGNSMWAYESFLINNMVWVWMGIFFSAWDFLLTLSRIYHFDMISFFAPLINFLNKWIP